MNNMSVNANVDKEIKELKEELHGMGIKTDRDLVKSLNVNEEDKHKLYTWIKYQSAFAYRSGYEIGQDDLKHQITVAIRL